MADGQKPSEPNKQAEHNPDDLTCNSKLWLGKDYSNFIQKDWNQLDKPFEGTLSKPPSVSHTHANTLRGSDNRELKGLPFIYFQITSTALEFPACRGVICLQLFMAKLPEM